MLNIISITDARKNFAKIIKKVNTTKEPYIIIQDSTPSAIIYPYDEKNRLFKLRFEQIFSEGEKIFKDYLKKENIQDPATEEEAYSIIKNA